MKSMVKIEKLIRETAQQEQSTRESTDLALKKKINEQWGRIDVIVKELRESMQESMASRKKTAEEIGSLEDSVDEVKLVKSNTERVTKKESSSINELRTMIA